MAFYSFLFFIMAFNNAVSKHGDPDLYNAFKMYFLIIGFTFLTGHLISWVVKTFKEGDSARNAQIFSDSFLQTMALIISEKDYEMRGNVIGATFVCILLTFFSATSAILFYTLFVIVKQLWGRPRRR